MSRETNLIDAVNSKTQLAGSNKLELLLFNIGKDRTTGKAERFGINVFKIVEVMKTPEITKAPLPRPGVAGLVALRGNVIPVIDMTSILGMDVESTRSIIIVTEFNHSRQAFVVDAVDTIVGLDWKNIIQPPESMVRNGGFVTGLSNMEDDQLVQILDVEKILSTINETEDGDLKSYSVTTRDPSKRVFFCDDSKVARDQIKKLLDHASVSYEYAENGSDAWDKLDNLASEAQREGGHITDKIQMVISDIEMPLMDGFTLTKKIKADPRMKGLKVAIHSSISGKSNRDLAMSVGADEYLTKFDTGEIYSMLTRNGVTV